MVKKKSDVRNFDVRMSVTRTMTVVVVASSKEEALLKANDPSAWDVEFPGENVDWKVLGAKES